MHALLLPACFRKVSLVQLSTGEVLNQTGTWQEGSPQVTEMALAQTVI